MILVNTDYISGKNLEMLGLVKGSTIQSKNIGKDIKALYESGVSSVNVDVRGRIVYVTIDVIKGIQ